jgi:iron complex transport system permease protein
VLLLWLLSRPLDALALGDETARSLGLPVAGFRLAIVFAATITTAAAVSVAGIIGFVGLVAPHASRLVVGGRNSRLLPVSCLLGALLLLLADDAARALASPQEIPVSIVTSLVGGPFFLYLLRRRPGMAGELP